jgi:hypothetical protein
MAVEGVAALSPIVTGTIVSDFVVGVPAFAMESSFNVS